MLISALIFNAKLYRNLAVSQTMFFVHSQELISTMDSCKAPKLGTIAHPYLVSKTVLGIFEIPSPSHFLLPYFPPPKKRSILRTRNVFIIIIIIII